MKNVLMKFAGFFVEKVPVEQPVLPRQPQPPQQHQQQQQPPQQQQAYPAQGHAAGAGGMAHQQAQPQQQLLNGHFPSPSGATAVPRPHQGPANPLAVALRAWVPQEYANVLAPFGLHVIAAGGEITVDQARAYGAQVMIVSAECLGSHTHLLSNAQMPTVFIAPQEMLIPSRPGVIQVQEPLHASDVANACRNAVDGWAQAPR